ncbi:hypothetical protein OIU84_012679 [Salix udensis]|uniref:Uncharacterized protein n=1 Tax=Salix udensis TaxID=889485 RepID=A0AAD6JGK8_9ROSI|nr:hypothetical protein OIU84_012679 [Salix udensis]
MTSSNSSQVKVSASQLSSLSETFPANLLFIASKFQNQHEENNIKSMEEPQPVQDQDPPILQNLPVQNPDPNPNPDLPFTAPSDPPPPQPQPAVPTAPPPPVPPESKKRSLDNYGPIQECSYFKMRAVVKDISPHFLEMLRTVDFRSCKGAEELQEKLKLLMELYKQMTAEKLSTNTPMTAPNSGENGVGLKPQEQLHDTAEQSRAGEVFAKPSEKQQGEHSQNQGTHIVGGSAFGWNFITFPGSMPIYYGRTKELFRAAQVIL